MVLINNLENYYNEEASEKRSPFSCVKVNLGI